jgi:hypothetical protein
MSDPALSARRPLLDERRHRATLVTAPLELVVISAQIARHGTRHKHAIDVRLTGCQRGRLSVVFLFAGGSPLGCGTLARRTLEGFAMTGKRALWRARSSSCGVGDGAVAGFVLGDVGCPEELTSPVSFPVPRSAHHIAGHETAISRFLQVAGEMLSTLRRWISPRDRRAAPLHLIAPNWR